MAVLRKLITRFLIMAAYGISYISRGQNRSKNFHIGLIAEEFFHENLRGFGGFGNTVKNISDYYNSNGHSFKANVLLTSRLNDFKRPIIKKFHNADVLLKPSDKPYALNNLFHYQRLLDSMKSKLFICIDYYPSYEYPLLTSPVTATIIWIRDPRGQEEWKKLASVSLELKQRRKQAESDLIKLAQEKEDSIKKVIRLSRVLKRKIIFATNGHFLIDRAKR